MNKLMNSFVYSPQEKKKTLNTLNNILGIYEYPGAHM